MSRGVDLQSSRRKGQGAIVACPTKEVAAVLPDKPHRAFGEFYKSARFNRILDQKTTVLIHLATAMSAGCYP